MESYGASLAGQYFGVSPFILVAGPEQAAARQEPTVDALRRMGLRPEIVDDPERMPPNLFADTVWRLRLGQLVVAAGTPTDAALLLADPGSPDTDCVTSPLPSGWSAQGRCLAFAILPDPAPVGLDGQGRAAETREFFKVMVLLIDVFRASHLYWSPARLWSDAARFREAVNEMLQSGMPPVLHLVAFRRSLDGDRMETRGVAHFAGQELRVDDGCGLAPPELLRRVARLALDLILNGPIGSSRRVPGLAQNEMLQLIPATDADGTSRVIVLVERDRK